MSGKINNNPTFYFGLYFNWGMALVEMPVVKSSLTKKFICLIIA